jgi:type IV pilus assembly protein PilV
MNTDMPHHNRQPGPRRIHGVGLIEVLVAVAVLAFGLLGIAALQATALKNGQSSYQRSQAVTATYSILDRMRANRAVALIGGYDIPRTCVAPGAGDQAANDLRAWIQGMQDPSVLGEDACGSIDCQLSGSVTKCKIIVEWDDSRATAGDPGQELPTVTAL